MHADIKDSLLNNLQKAVRNQHGIHANVSILSSTGQSGIAAGIKDAGDVQLNQVAPAGQGIEAPLMKDEIGSPLINIQVYTDISTVIEEINRIRPSTICYFGQQDGAMRQRIERSTNSQIFAVNDCPVQSGNIAAPLGSPYLCGHPGIFPNGYLALSNQRAIYQRPNSHFLDLGVRYTATQPDPSRRLPSFKRLAGLASMHKSTVGTLILCSIILIALAILVYIIHRNDWRVISFPRLE